VRAACLAALVAGLVPAAGIADARHAPHWGYSGAEGPAHWAVLAPEFRSCSGKQQSPIDIRHATDKVLPPLHPAYRDGGFAVVNNGHTEQVEYAPGSSLTLDGVRYELRQLHFHAPSENRIEGKAFPLEAHLVHADRAGHLAVLAVMFEDGSENAALAQLWPKLPDKAGAKQELATPFAAASLLPSTLDYYRFIGSLTTPPCTEGVRWLVLKTPVPASKAQVGRFASLMHHPNNRPVQPVNARPVLQ
jgi:carbonic anhydrase